MASWTHGTAFTFARSGYNAETSYRHRRFGTDEKTVPQLVVFDCRNGGVRHLFRVGEIDPWQINFPESETDFRDQQAALDLANHF